MFRGFYHPDLSLHLLGYLNVIRGLARLHPLRIWMAYDLQFRQNMQQGTASDTMWLSEDPVLMAESLRKQAVAVPTQSTQVASPAPQTSRACYICRDANHLANVCPQRRLPSSSTGRQQAPQAGTSNSPSQASSSGWGPVASDDATRIVTELGPGAHVAKLDVKSAFRLIPLRREDWNLLGYWHDEKFHFDVVLPFGLRSSPGILNWCAGC
ncbi:hypothetical protein RvY_03149 [Ramazzottius varieornatus]|uniref:CCHC-type domain-containing protein n=1 Tax=Ramazzottius varieornatus TaxID=947166 RepID=A0A1D1UQT9_RAMVA|nr:hypothetical protein RvY_03149 [Ramazzottius varieornatus]